MFTETIRNVHPDITEQSASELREFLVTAHERHQSDSQSLSLGLQAVQQEILDQGYDWSDLITNLVDLICADLPEYQHKRFVAELDRLYSGNESLLEVRSVMASDYPSALEALQNLIQDAGNEHEELAGMAGGTSRFIKTWQKDPNRTRTEKAEAIGADIAEAGVGVAVISGLAYGAYRLATRGARAAEVESIVNQGIKESGIAREGGIVRIERPGHDPVDVDTRTVIDDSNSSDIVFRRPNFKNLAGDDDAGFSVSDFRDELAEPIGDINYRREAHRLQESDLSNRVARPRANTEPSRLPSNPERDLMRPSLDKEPEAELTDIARRDAAQALDDAASDITNDARAEINVEESIESDLD